MNIGLCRCGVRWQQVGNRTGHCAACHRTFASLDAFDAHQQLMGGLSICRDPAAIVVTESATVRTPGDRKFRTFVDPVGATVWRSVDEMPTGTFKRGAA